MSELDRVVAALTTAPSVAVLSHVDPEGDAIGATLGAAFALREAGKHTRAYNRDGVPPWLAHLPGASELLRIPPAAEGYACYLVLDTSDLTRTGGLLDGRPAGAVVVNVDHHAGNTRFGDVNWIEATASSAGEMVHRLLRRSGFPVPREAAVNLYAALYTDTGGFRYGNTTAEALRVGADLVTCGADPQDVARRLYGHKDVREWRLLSEVLAGLQVSAGGRLAWIEVSLGAQRRAGVGLEVTDEFVQYPRSLEGVQVAAAFKEITADEIRVSLRSNGGVDVAKLAAGLGGGGHRNAAGCTLRASLAEARALVLPTIEAALGED